jgi:ABC-2 type transport system ATP-binding protein
MDLRPLLEAREARIAVDGVLAFDRLDITTEGERVFFVGDTTALFAAITNCPVRRTHAQRPPDEHEEQGEASVVAGSLKVAGFDVAHADHLSVIGAAPLDPPLPPSWTSWEYVSWSARLAGSGTRGARDLAESALARVGVGASMRKPLAMVPLPERRAVVLAQAIVTSPSVLVAEAPLSGLEGAAAAFVMQAIAAASAGRGALLSASRLDPGSAEGTLARSATYVVVLAGGTLALAGPPAEVFSGATHYALTVKAKGPELRAELASRGIDLRGGPLRFSAALPVGFSTRELVVAARAVDASIVELVPIVS